jgi:hypothetical protein
MMRMALAWAASSSKCYSLSAGIKKVAPEKPGVGIAAPFLIQSNGIDSQKVPAILQESA